MGEGVLANSIANVPGRAVVNGQLNGAINDVVRAVDAPRIASTGMARGNISYGNLEVEKGDELLGKIQHL